MTTPINVPVTFPGVTDSQGAMLALAQAVAGLANNVSTLGQKQNDQKQKQDASTTSAQQATQQAIAFGQRLAGVANAVQNLTARFGGGGTTAGLIGSIANTTTQFAQMGAALGPGGAVAGAVVGFTASLLELRDAHTAVAAAAHAQQEAEADLAAAARQAQQDTTHGLAVQLQTQRTLIAGYEQDIADLEQSSRDAARGTLSLSGLAGAGDALLSGTTVQGRIDTLRQMIEGARAVEAQLDASLRRGGQDDATGLAGLTGQQGPTFGGLASEGDVAATTGLASSSQHREGGGNALLDQKNKIIEANHALAASEEEAAQAAEDAATREMDAATAALEAQKQKIDEIREHEAQADEAERQRALHSLEQFMQAQERAHAESQRIMQEHAQEAQQGTQALIGNLTNVFTLMAAGQANAAQGAELLLAGFLQYISQRATIEALAQVAQGIGSYPDFGGMALHFAAAAAWGAVAVATGVGSAALTSDAQGQAAAAASQAQQKPAEPQHSAGDKGGGGNTTLVVNFNNSIPLTSQQAQAAVRPLRRWIGQSEQRFPTG